MSDIKEITKENLAKDKLISLLGVKDKNSIKRLLKKGKVYKIITFGSNPLEANVDIVDEAGLAKRQANGSI